jgi:hypothetical protein
MQKPTKDDLAEIASVFGDLKEEDFDEWLAQNRAAIEGLDLGDIPTEDLHAIADRIREWKKKKAD